MKPGKPGITDYVTHFIVAHQWIIAWGNRGLVLSLVLSLTFITGLLGGVWEPLAFFLLGASFGLNLAAWKLRWRPSPPPDRLTEAQASPLDYERPRREEPYL